MSKTESRMWVVMWLGAEYSERAETEWQTNVNLCLHHTYKSPRLTMFVIGNKTPLFLLFIIVYVFVYFLL